MFSSGEVRLVRPLLATWSDVVRQAGAAEQRLEENAVPVEIRPLPSSIALRIHHLHIELHAALFAAGRVLGFVAAAAAVAAPDVPRDL